MRAIRRTLQPGRIDDALRWCQRTIGQQWITLATGNLHRVHHLERLEPLAPIAASSWSPTIEVSSICTCSPPRCCAGKLRHRIVFPVRSNFFYDTPAGFLVNGVMSFFAMYPPLFRDKRLTTLNALGWRSSRGYCARRDAGRHSSEGRRNPGDDPYQLLPAKSGVGRLIHAARGVPVIPVFTNGLLPNNLPRQVLSNFDGTGIPIHSVFGMPIDFSDLLSEPASPRLFTRLSERCLDEVRKLGREEKVLRAARAAASTT
jgi:1-acyl-sn-glycerol-3-phosphate acyltransferase